MPMTVNGIGTMYYGRRNDSSYQGECRQCRQPATLRSYDTGHYFVVLFIPLIPLGKKRIIDECSRCQRHWVAKQGDYEVAQRKTIAAALEAYQDEPSAEKALQLHATLLGYGEHTQAAKFRAEATEAYPENGEFFGGLAAQLEQVGRTAEAGTCYEKAWELRPDLLFVRVAMAYLRMNAGKLDEAREMLNFFEVPGGLQQYGAGPVDSLAGCYQAQGRHEEALELCQQMLDAFPQLGRQFKFRKFVLVSEQALEREATILPTQSPGLFALFNPKNEAYSPGQHWAAIGVVAFGLALIGAVLSNTFIRRNRTVHLVSGFAQPAQVQIDGGPPISVRGRATTTLSEGKHHAKVLSPIQTEFDFDMQTSYLSRWDRKPAWVLNVGSTVPLLEETLIYATNPRPGVSKYLEMQPFTFIPHIDYPFEEPPKELKLESRTSEVKKTSLSVPPHQPSGILASLGTPAVALIYAEDQLAVHPNDLTLLRNYADLATDEATTVRVEKFLKAGLSKRPLHIGWHRAYQDLFKKSGGEPQVIAEYDALLQAEPGNGGLIYLRGRVDPDEQKSAELYRQAATADEQLPWPWFGLAVQAGSRADWQECAQCVEIARERKLDAALIQHLRHVAMLAVNTPNMEHVARLELAADPTNAGLLLPMCDILAVKGDREGAMHALTVWESRSALPADVSIAVRQPVLYMLGDFAALNKSLKEQPEFSAPGLRREALLLEGRAKEAAEDPQLVALNDDPWAMLSLSLGFGLAKDLDNAALWRQRAAKRLEREDTRGKFVAQLLTADAAPTLEAANAVSLYINHKPLLVAALLQKFPEQRATYAPLLEKLLVSRMQPYHLVKRVLDAQ